MSTPSPEPASLFERVGGEPAIRGLVQAFYDRVLSDPQLAPFFTHTSMERLHRMQFEFFSAALGGPVAYTGLPIAYAHHGRGIGPAHISRFLDHLLATLQEHDLREQDVYEIISRINLYTTDLTARTPTDG
ncbi:MAG: group 1 truncated hemoglobin [Bryobacteraceae bacterium]|nr:group 1 truncated hemoglobin [Bryobacteraceae bacterium]